jgi:ubiquinone/menaquinone biosynthesis C-methylase UbiE
MEGSFEPIADWWDAHAGDAGDFFHQHLILPALLAALGEVAGLPVLDLGCGNGAVSRILARAGAHVTGVDISPTLIARAQQREQRAPLGITYRVADAAALSMFAGASFAGVSANTVLMDAADGGGILREVARLLQPSGRFVASLLHPCFEVPGHSDWASEETPTGERLMRRVWRYQESFSTPFDFDAERLAPMGDDALTQERPLMRYHRPLSWYATQMRAGGLLIDTLDEPVGDDALAQERPRSAPHRRIAPSFLILGAVKVSSAARGEPRGA